ncbi:DUF6215 domain-containing protein [Streptomyces sp. NPDC005648]|uniref:DUF6215 domain-containing protein n=1 Tax=Streptomyces sp. NPDC005648 TaxID=3157044 RepID=UPI0033B9BE96
MVDDFADSRSATDEPEKPVKATGEPEKSMNVAAQVIAAIVVVGGLAGLLWALDLDSKASADRGPAACTTAHDTKPSKPVSGAQLCTALNRPDLPVLLGTPSEYAETADGNESTLTSADGTKSTTPEADVDLKTYSVRLSASGDDIGVADMAGLLGTGAEKKTMLGHPAVLYSDRTIALSFNLGGGKAKTGPGGIARCLLVARDAKDGGGYYEVSIWRQDFATPDDAALFRVAEKVLPTVPGWTVG